MSFIFVSAWDHLPFRLGLRVSTYNSFCWDRGSLIATPPPAKRNKRTHFKMDRVDHTVIPRYTTYSRHFCAETHGLCLATGRCGKRLERFLEVAVDVLIFARNKSQVPLGSLEEASVIKAPPRLVPFNTRGDCFTEYLKFNREDMEVGLVSIFPRYASPVEGSLASMW